MNSRTISPSRSKSHETINVVDAARSVIAAKGAAGMSLRTVAEEAGTSVGAISYRIGDRAALIAAVVDREIELIAETRAQWRVRLGDLDPLAAGILPDLVCEWLDEGARGRRTSAIVTCELALMASRDPRALPAIGTLLGGAEGLWRDLLSRSAEGERLARLIARYCLDEQVFSILLADETDYRLLRHSTIRGMLRRSPATADPASSWHMTLIERLAVPAATAYDEASPVPKGMKRTIAGHIADIIVSHGVGALSHRTVAQTVGIATSSVAHHFPAQRDILFAGVEAVYRRLRSHIHAAGERPGNGDIIRLTHECALAALSDPAFRPFAIDMRRRRAENVHALYAEWLGIPENSDRARVQAMVMASIGNGLLMLATEGDWPDMRALVDTLR
ncbi:helix-turn-helix domain-containing protein [Novosphingobium resinovorum]|uniref:helix-turn-helix domain-containing protein n=1 Tax=Novosphingobium resinovorum TaxID=158500 RepID=UPI002ED12462|nr:helix-turn-helix domain-containing protein [Novosphingobium resinovorum]